MLNRRRFLLSSLSATLGISLPFRANGISAGIVQNGPLFVSTWEHGLKANSTAMKKLSSDGNILDSVEAGVRVSEADPKVSSVGYGGIPDASGDVTLDACIMDSMGNAGSVACLKDIKHPVSVARMVMEKTDHVMLVGQGAQDFALEQGFRKENLITEKALKEWERIKSIKSEGKAAGHDTIGMIGMDAERDIAGACTTSGIGYKLPGRVGDSPIIGAGLYVDNEIGAASATGHGELVMKTLGSFLIVELMRNGYSPTEACIEALTRIRKKIKLEPEHQVGFICLDKKGQYAGYSLKDGFKFAVAQNGVNQLHDSEYL
jgi:L-asparaginase/N4-(beta-N-acetylglucosaminyl)-L-asparaginase